MFCCRMKKDNADVLAVIAAIVKYINPYNKEDDHLISLVSGSIANSKAQADLLNVYQVGKDAADNFTKQRITSHDVDFFAPLRANRLSAFVPTKKAKSTKETKAEMTSSDRSLFARLFVVGRTREIDLEKIMSYPLCAVSVPLAIIIITFDRQLKVPYYDFTRT